MIYSLYKHAQSLFLKKSKPKRFFFIITHLYSFIDNKLTGVRSLIIMPQAIAARTREQIRCMYEDTPHTYETTKNNLYNKQQVLRDYNQQVSKSINKQLNRYNNPCTSVYPQLYIHTSPKKYNMRNFGLANPNVKSATRARGPPLCHTTRVEDAIYLASPYPGKKQMLRILKQKNNKMEGMRTTEQQSPLDTVNDNDDLHYQVYQRK